MSDLWEGEEEVSYGRENWDDEMELSMVIAFFAGKRDDGFRRV